MHHNQEKITFALMNEIAILLGSNLNNRLQIISTAIEQINLKIGEISKKSSVYETPAWGYASKNDFLNQVLIVKSSKSVHAILTICLAIETELGRNRNQTSGYSDRTIDIDILLFNQEIVTTTDLTIPHPRMHKRIFCLQPLNEIAPDWKVPMHNKTVNHLLNECTDSSLISKYEIEV